jgi:hypothetical protein
MGVSGVYFFSGLNPSFQRRLPLFANKMKIEAPVLLTSSHELDTLDLNNPAGLRFIKLLGKQHWRDIIQR